ncbi:MAG TPA: hypothetical protein DCX07_08295 [Phycisphaerales bacterium]|nr:hypothetical protein [Phycisphaerales bacterium]
MEPLLGVTVQFFPPKWTVVMTVAAVLALGWELGALLRSLWRGRSPGAAILLSLGALAAGPLVAAAAAVFAAAGDGHGRSRRVLLECLRGTLLALLAIVAVQWRPNGAPAGAIVAVIAAAVVWAVRAYRKTTAPVPSRLKRTFLILRMAALVLLAMALLRPTLAYEKQEEVRSVVLVGVDTSSSMSRRDMPTDYTQTLPAAGAEPAQRIDAVRQALAASRGALARLAEQADVEVFTFTSTALPLATIDRDHRRVAVAEAIPTAAGPATAIADSAAALFEQAARAGRNVAALILLSDGCSNADTATDPERLAAGLAAAGVPIYTVGVGSETVVGSLKTLNVREMTAPDEVQAFNRLPISARIDALGLKGREVEVTCTFGDKEVGKQTFTLDSGRRTLSVEFAHVPLAVGTHRLTVGAKLIGTPPRDLGGRPAAAKLVRVHDTGLRILYIEGKFRFESKYITRALASGQKLSVDRRVLLQPLQEDRPPPLGEKLEDWLSYHAILLGDVAASHFTPKQLEIIKELVSRRGKGLCMIGGRNSFGPGGWGGTPVADVLPVKMDKSSGQIDRDVKIVPTAEGKADPLMQIDPLAGDVSAAWAKLPEMPGASRLGELKLGAVALATDRGTGEPMIVVQQYGSGRSLVIAFDTTWQWVLSPEPTEESQKRFWRQVALYLAAPKGNLWISTDRSSYELRKLAAGVQTIEVTAGVEDPSGRTIPNPTVEATISAPDGKATAVRLSAGADKLRGQLRPPAQAGVYTLRIKTNVAGQELTAEHRFEIGDTDLESLDVLANMGLLRQMSVTTNGRFVPLSSIEKMFQDLQVEARPEIRRRLVYEDLAATHPWPLVIAYIALLCLEWAVRKRKGLV